MVALGAPESQRTKFSKPYVGGRAYLIVAVHFQPCSGAKTLELRNREQGQIAFHQGAHPPDLRLVDGCPAGLPVGRRSLGCRGADLLRLRHGPLSVALRPCPETPHLSPDRRLVSTKPPRNLRPAVPLLVQEFNLCSLF